MTIENLFKAKKNGRFALMKRLIFLALYSLLLLSPVMAQARFGVKGGGTMGHLRFDGTMLDSENRLGWTAGLQLEVELPVVGFGVETSVMYTHRNTRLAGVDHTYKRNYVEIPVHLRYKLTIIGMGRIVAPYVFTGPNFGLLCAETDNTGWENRKTNLSWDAGFGMELFRHLQLSASYGLGITKAFRKVGLDHNGESIEGRDHCWTVTAAYLF